MRKFATKWYIALCVYIQSIVRECVNLSRRKADFSERGLKKVKKINVSVY